MKSFDSLDLYYKSDILIQQATYLLSVGYYHFTVKLYSWDRFFIEEYYDTEQEVVTQITLAAPKDLQKYLKNISLLDLGAFTVV